MAGLRNVVLLVVNVLFVKCWVKEMENPNLFQGDMILTPAQREFYTKGRSQSYGSIADVTKLWSQGIVPYVITSSLQQNPKAMAEIKEAIKQYHTYTCIKFVPRNRERDYVKFYHGNSCSSMVGKQTWSQYISLGSGCWWRGTIMHEIGHALGFEHEQSRPDRDDYVEIIWRNLDRSVHSQFLKSPESHINSLGTKYDVRSMMHYAWNSFSKKMSIKTKDPRDQYEIGQKDGFSHIDIQQINLLYKCNGTYPTLPPYVRPPPGCYDISPFCAKNAHEGRCNQPSWQAFMHAECRRTCKLCGGSSTSTTTTTTTKVAEMTTNAPKTASGKNTIKSTKITSTKTVYSTVKGTATVSKTCRDRVSTCSQFPKERCSSTNKSWKYFMERSCKKYCRFC